MRSQGIVASHYREDQVNQLPGHMASFGGCLMITCSFVTLPLFHVSLSLQTLHLSCHYLYRSLRRTQSRQVMLFGCAHITLTSITFIIVIILMCLVDWRWRWSFFTSRDLEQKVSICFLKFFHAVYLFTRRSVSFFTIYSSVSLLFSWPKVGRW